MVHTHVTYESITLSSIEGKSQTKLFQISNDENPISWEATCVVCRWTNRNRRPQTFLMLLSETYRFHFPSLSFLPAHCFKELERRSTHHSIIHFSNSAYSMFCSWLKALTVDCNLCTTICALLSADHSPWSTINAQLFAQCNQSYNNVSFHCPCTRHTHTHAYTGHL